jgi:phospholipase/lecithinase/hemolysin
VLNQESRMRSNFRKAIPFTLALCFLIAAPHTAAADDRLVQLVVFGDSLSDSGNSPAPTPPHFDSRWSNGYTYADDLAPRFGLGDRLIPSSAGGTNYSRGTARITSSGGLLDQVASYVHDAQLSADKRTLHLVFIGGNDMRDGIVGALTSPSFNPAAFVDARLATLAVTLSGLSALGARTIAIMNLPDLSKLPGLPPQAGPLATFMTTRFNVGLSRIVDILSKRGGRATLVDVSTFFNSILADAAAGGPRFGITNVTEPCLTFVNGVPTAQCANPETYLFWDPIHPTGRVHQFLSDFVAEALEGQDGSF